MSEHKFNDKDLEIIKDRAVAEWKQINGENTLARAYFYSVCVWLKGEGLLNCDEVPVYKPRSLAIDNTPED